MSVLSVRPYKGTNGKARTGYGKALIKNVYLNLYLMGKDISGCCTAVQGPVLILPVQGRPQGSPTDLNGPSDWLGSAARDGRADGDGHDPVQLPFSVVNKVWQSVNPSERGWTER